MVHDIVLSPRPLSSLSALLPFTLKHDGPKPRGWRGAATFVSTNKQCRGVWGVKKWCNGLSPGASHQSPGCAHQLSQWGAVALQWQMVSVRRRGWEQTGMDSHAGPGGRCAREEVSEFVQMHLSVVNAVQHQIAIRGLVSPGKRGGWGGNWSINGWTDTYPRHCFTGHSILEKTSFCLTANGDN